MTVADVMSYQPVTVGELQTVQEAARLMRAHVVGALPVLSDPGLVGIVTDRDLAVRVVAAGARPWETRVREVMTRAPATCRREEALEAAVERMAARRIRRLVVVDASGAAAGMLSVDDLVLMEQTRQMALRILQQIATVRGDLDGTFADVHP
jgi:CBS domain-containing protein